MAIYRKLGDYRIDIPSGNDLLSLYGTIDVVGSQRRFAQSKCCMCCKC